MLTQCIALDHGPEGVRANCVCPGWVRTPMADERDGRARRAPRHRSRGAPTTRALVDVPLRRAATPEEIAATVAWLALATTRPTSTAPCCRSTAATRRSTSRPSRSGGSPREPRRRSPASRSRPTTSSAASASRATRRFTDSQPIDAEPIAEVARGGEREAALAVAAATEAFPAWAALGAAGSRRAYLHRLADLIDANVDRLAAVECADMAMLLRSLRGAA